jgi:excinuclease ABC subunit B
MYASRITKSMAFAISETERRRELQLEYNRVNNIDPTPLRKKIADITSVLAREKADTEALIGSGTTGVGEGFLRTSTLRGGAEELSGLIATITDQMMQASQELKFELAAKLRDEVVELKRELRQLTEATR